MGIIIQNLESEWQHSWEELWIFFPLFINNCKLKAGANSQQAIHILWELLIDNEIALYLVLRDPVLVISQYYNSDHLSVQFDEFIVVSTFNSCIDYLVSDKLLFNFRDLIIQFQLWVSPSSFDIVLELNQSCQSDFII